jgi:2-oxoglutarate ferredoxin oxidoreductase subunit alpha
MNLKNEFVIAISGKAGQGVLSMGDFIQQIVQNIGLYSFVWVDYPSLIKGGHNVVFIRVSNKPVFAPVEDINYLITLDTESIDIHWDEIVKKGVLIYDIDIVKNCFKNIKFYKPEKLDANLLKTILYNNEPTYLNLKRKN